MFFDTNQQNQRMKKRQMDRFLKECEDELFGRSRQNVKSRRGRSFGIERIGVLSVLNSVSRIGG